MHSAGAPLRTINHEERADLTVGGVDLFQDLDHQVLHQIVDEDRVITLIEVGVVHEVHLYEERAIPMVIPMVIPVVILADHH